MIRTVFARAARRRRTAIGATTSARTQRATAATTPVGRPPRCSRTAAAGVNRRRASPASLRPLHPCDGSALEPTGRPRRASSMSVEGPASTDRGGAAGVATECTRWPRARTDCRFCTPGFRRDSVRWRPAARRSVPLGCTAGAGAGAGPGTGGGGGVAGGGGPPTGSGTGAG